MMNIKAGRHMIEGRTQEEEEFDGTRETLVRLMPARESDKCEQQARNITCR